MTQNFKRPALAGSPSRRAAFTYVGVAQDAQCQRLADRCALVHLKLVERAARPHYLAVAAEAVETGAGTPVEILEQELASLNQQLAQAEADRAADAEWHRAWRHHLEPVQRVANRIFTEVQAQIANDERFLNSSKSGATRKARYDVLIASGLSHAEADQVLTTVDSHQGQQRNHEEVRQRLAEGKRLIAALEAWVSDPLRDAEPLRAHPELAPVVAELERLAAEAEAAEAVKG